MASNSISKRFQMTIMAVTFSAITILAAISIFVKYRDFYKETKLIKETYIKDQEQIIKFEVESAVADIELKFQNKPIPQDQFEKRIVNQYRVIRFPNRGKDLGFFFIKTYTGIQKLSVSKPEIEDADVADYKDPNGIITHDLFMKIINEEGSGFADYSWYNPYTYKNQEKRSFIKAIPSLEWYIGAGFWFEDINSVIEAKRTLLHNDVKKFVFYLIIITIGFFIIIYLISKSISDKIRDNFIKFSMFFTEAAKHHAIIEKEELHYKEFEDLSISANTMISERIKAEKDLSVMAHALKSISDCVSITDLENNIVFLNDSFLKTFGYEADELIGKNIDIVRSEKNTEELLSSILKETKSGGWEGEIWNKRKDGTEFQINLSTSVIRNINSEIVALVGVSRDVTEQKRNELLQQIIYNIAQAANTSIGVEELIEIIKEQLHLIINTKNFYVAFYNKSDDTFSSPFFYDIKDKSIDSWPAGKTLSAYVYKTKIPQLLTIDQLKELLEKDGVIEFVGSLPKVWLGVPLKVKGSVYGVFAVQCYSDEVVYTQNDLEMLEFVSHQIGISIERKKGEDELYKAYEKAKESDQLKSAFLATMSHELRTPLNSVIGFSELIDKEAPKEKVLEYVKLINNSGKHLLEIVEDIFDVTLLEVGQVKLNKETYSLSSILQSIQDMVINEKFHKKSNVEIIYKSNDNKDIEILTDKGKLSQIVINLLKNALKFTNKGFIEFGYEKIDKLVKIYVKDTGIGIAKEDQKMVFEIFRQADDSLTRNYGGTGIGLFVVKRYAELLGGKVELESELGKGSTFCINLPISEEIIKKKDDPKSSEKTVFSSNTILIVEDDELSAQLLIEILEADKLKCLTAKNGREAVEICEKNQNIDLVLMDLKMPVMDGIKATKLIKEKQPDLKIVAQTAHAVPGDREEALNAGCDDYIAKPIMKDELDTIFQKYLI